MINQNVMPQTFNLDLNGADPTAKNPALPDGKFRVEILKASYFASRDPKKGATSFFVASYKVLHIFQQKPRVDSESGLSNQTSVGETRAYVGNTKYTQTPGKIKMFFCACAGINPESAKEVRDAKYPDGSPINWNELMAEAVGESNCLEGRIIDVTVETTLTDNKFLFPVHSFAPVKAVEEPAAEQQTAA